MRNVNSAADVNASSVHAPLVRLELFGAPRLVKGDVTSRLERRTAAVLAYLALEGEAVKYQLAGWLWAESQEATARNNMRQLLRRLRQSAGVEVIEGEDRIRLSEHVVADAQEMQAHAFAGDHAKALEFHDELLEGFEFDDSPDFEAWLLTARESLAALRRSAAAGESERLEGLGELSAALRFALEHVRLEPLSEEAHRRVMRLHYLTGDRSAALQAFETLRRTLEIELGVEPLPETVVLMREIERGATLPVTAAPASRTVPLSVLRPPILAGREREWAQLEVAWAAGQFIAVSGEAGSGKSRLMMDFVTSKVPRESVLLLQSRPGDSSVPYSSHARNWRSMLEQFKPDLEPWVRQELARLVPELGASPGPIRNEAEKLRFFQAKLESMIACTRVGLQVLISDDVQFTDPASGEASLYMMGAAPAAGLSLRAVYGYRPDEIPESIAVVLRHALDAGVMAHVPLEPLDADGISALLHGLNLPGAADLIAPLARYTGGNPMFVLETVKHLYETGQLERGWPGRLPPPGKVGALVQRRLERLSANALHLAQAAGGLKRDFNVELVAEMLGISPLEALSSWSELEAAQVMTGERFSHDLVFETVAANTPEATKRWLNRRAAETLEATASDAARIAGHWLEGGDDARAAPWSQRAAERAKEAYRFVEAAAFYGDAARAFEATGDRGAAFAALYERTRLLPNIEGGADETEHLLELATTPRELALAWHARALILEPRGSYADAERAARQGLTQLEGAPDADIELDLHEILGTTLWFQRRYPESLESLRRTIALAEAAQNTTRLVNALNDTATVLGNLNRFEEAVELLRRAQVLVVGLEDRVTRAEVLTNLARLEAIMGRAASSIALLLEARSALHGVDGALGTRVSIAEALGTSYATVGKYALALEEFDAALPLIRGDAPIPFWAEVLEKDRALLLVSLGALEDAEIALAGFLERENPLRPNRCAALYTLAALRAEQGRTHAHLFQEAEGLLLSTHGDQLLEASYFIARSPHLPPADALELSQRAEAIAMEADRPPQRLAALIRQAQALLRLNRPEEALERCERFLELHKNSDIASLDRNEFLLTHFQTLQALNDPRASEALRDALTWVLETARDRVPPAYRRGFLEDHRTNRAILEAAKNAGLEVQVFS
jgi:DNA-binding SARP family transcriptional activator/tetratricopeptide (TPR) repeat protein